jgi:hypothetical protein
VATLVASYEKPVVAFSALRKDVNDLGMLPRWAGLDGQRGSKDLEAAVLAFNHGELDGLAITFSFGCCGFRLWGAKTLVMIGTAPANVMAQAAARAPGATTVLL